MKTFLTTVTLCALAIPAFADIQDPPGNDYGPTRKLGRALANMAFHPNEVPTTIATINYREGNEAAASYGVVKGFGRSFYRLGMGIFEFATWPFPIYKGSYRPPYKREIPWIHGGYEEFPPELGFATKYHYTRHYDGYP